jgi:hypothetical protein
VSPKPPPPLWRWAVWWAVFALGILLFYVLLTPFWQGIRILAWAAELRARRRARAYERRRAGRRTSLPDSTR